MNMIYRGCFHRMSLFTIFCILLFTTSGCSYCKKIRLRMMIRHEYGRVLDFSWSGSQIMSDTILTGFEIKKPITIVSHIDAKLCPECFANYLRGAEKYVSLFNSDSIQYVCIAYPRPIDELQYALSLSETDPSKVMVVYDSNNLYLKNNSLTKLSSGYNAFLIDKDHKIILLGDPIRIQSMYDLCKSHIQSMLDGY